VADRNASASTFAYASPAGRNGFIGIGLRPSRDSDLAGRRTKLTWPVDASSPTAYYANYDYLVTGEVEKVREKGATSGAGVLAIYGYDDLGRRTSITRGNGATTSYGYDSVSRLISLGHDFSGTAQDLTLTFAYNPASQIVSTMRTNDLYAWTGHGNGTTSSTADGRNRLSSHAGATPTYDGNGNLTSDASTSYTYSSENLLVSTGSSGPLEYDPLMRFYKNYTQYFIHDGVTGQLIGDYYNGSIVGRYVPGAAADEPVGFIDKFGNRIWHHTDERGSIIAGSNDAGANARIVLYDEYGKRGSGGSYRFAYTGQAHLINDVYDYKSRNYYARLGRFGQTDRIGYAGGMNLYAYVGADPINFIDLSGNRRVTGGERQMLNSVFGEYASYPWIFGLDIPNSMYTPWEIDIVSGHFSSDYSKEKDPKKLEEFWNEFYHAFEVNIGVLKFSDLVWNAVTTLHSNDAYRYDPKKPFMDQNPEARAEYFGNCMAGLGPCTELKDFSFRPDSQTVVKFSNGKFTVIVS
jgi:RHS repeat-associated protein